VYLHGGGGHTVTDKLPFAKHVAPAENATTINKSEVRASQSFILRSLSLRQNSDQHEMIKAITRLGLGQQLGLAAGLLCLLTSLSLVIVSAISSRHMQQQQMQEYGAALANQIARRITTTLETGDLLNVAASLQRFVETSSAERVAIFDLEGRSLGQAGDTRDKHVHEYSAPVRIDNDTAGEVVIALNVDQTRAAQRQFVLSLAGLTALLSLGIYAVARHMGQRTGKQLQAMAEHINLQNPPLLNQTSQPANEVLLLKSHIDELPMELLRTRQSGDTREEHYQQVSILFVQLDSLANYVDTLDQTSLQRYTRRLHQVVAGAAGFYGGQLQVTRQFGISVFFSGINKAGSQAFRAASCGWLVKELCQELGQQQRLSMKVSLAVASSETGMGDDNDIYPGLYIQHVLDELQTLCAKHPQGLLLHQQVCTDPGVVGKITVNTTVDNTYTQLDGFIEPYNDLLERQLRLVWKRLTTT